uniref:Uncharacterized protein n=2 Tax=unclassified Caudoviricetes TaxID=2788787 RepID=A0A8S5PZ86_9CAUD|nr:MAG TPA: hypothetical protein [Siphoviridae sp. ctkL634]DAE12350.1 MAG TPA: hypothetical protein [Siphoviridae sp. ctG0D7]
MTNFHGLKRFSTKTILFLKNCTGATGKGDEYVG